MSENSNSLFVVVDVRHSFDFLHMIKVTSWEGKKKKEKEKEKEKSEKWKSEHRTIRQQGNSADIHSALLLLYNFFFLLKLLYNLKKTFSLL